jgi:hypothetical protein
VLEFCSPLNAAIRGIIDTPTKARIASTNTTLTIQRLRALDTEPSLTLMRLLFGIPKVKNLKNFTEYCDLLVKFITNSQ